MLLARRGCIAYANEMLKGLEDVELKIYASRFCEEPLPPNVVLIPTFKNSFEFIWRSLFYLPFLLWKVREDIQQGYRIIYFPVFHHWNFVIIWLAKWLNVKTLLTVHDAISHLGERQVGQDAFQHWATQAADTIIVLSSFVKSQLKSTLQSKSVIIHHPILLHRDIQFRTLPAKPSLLFLGRIAVYKGVDLLLEAVQDLPAGKISHLTIAGMPLQEINIPKTSFPIKTIFRWLEDKELQKLLIQHDILVLPYREASQSGVITLGISSAIPMMVTKVGGLTEQLTEDEAVWVNPTVESVRAGILNLIESPDLYQDLHQNLSKKYKQTEQTDVSKQLLEAIYDLCNNLK